MPNPKRRHSKSRGRKRRTHDALTCSGLSECPNCHELRVAASYLSALWAFYRAVNMLLKNKPKNRFDA